MSRIAFILGVAASILSAHPNAQAPAPSMPLNTVTASGAFQGQTVTATHALAWWSAPERQVRLVLFDHPPSTGMLTAAKTGSFGEEGPLIRVSVGFAGPGRTLADVSDCFVNVTFPTGGPIGTNTDAQGCGLERVVTDGTPGGTVQLVMKGSGMAGLDARFSWDIALHVPIAK